MQKPNGLGITHERGTEGPKHDPYAWELWNVLLPNKTKVLYRDAALGGSYVKVYNAVGDEIAEVTGEDVALMKYFEKIVGHKVETLYAWVYPSDGYDDHEDCDMYDYP